jgi:hypothetical protein
LLILAAFFTRSSSCDSVSMMFVCVDKSNYACSFYLDKSRT